MDLYNHPDPPFTKWIVRNGLLDSRFVIVDIGIQGGEHPRWRFLGPFAEIHGFDAIEEVIEDLRERHVGIGNRHYYSTALGDENGTRRFFIAPNRFGSSFYNSNPEAEERLVPIRRLDSLYCEGTLPCADYIKLDCEGFEPEILRGARRYLEASGPICVTTETNFGVSEIVPYGHFQAVNEILIQHRLLVFDLNLVRAPRPSYRQACDARPLSTPNPLTESPELDVGSPTTIDAVFCRDLVDEDASPDRYAFKRVPEGPPSLDKLIKAMINFELHGLMDCAYELATRFRARLEKRFDVDEACGLLLVRPPVPRNTADVVNCLRMITQLRKQVVWRTEYVDWGSTEQLLPSSSQSAERSHGAAIMGLGYAFTAAGEKVRMHLVVTAFSTESNEFVAGVFDKQRLSPVALASRPIPRGARTTIDETFTIESEGAGWREFEIRVGLGCSSGTLFLNGDERGPDTTWPRSYFEIGRVE